MTRYLRTSQRHYIFAILCGCGYYAEVGVTHGCRDFVVCPECSALYLLSEPGGMFGLPGLTLVYPTEVASC